MMWHYIELDLAVDLPAWLAGFLLIEIGVLLANHARFVEEHGE